MKGAPSFADVVPVGCPYGDVQVEDPVFVLAADEVLAPTEPYPFVSSPGLRTRANDAVKEGVYSTQCSPLISSSRVQSV